MVELWAIFDGTERFVIANPSLFRSANDGPDFRA